MTTVTNMETGQELTYTLPPKKAVINAWYQGQGNWNTWDYDYEIAPVIEGAKTLTCGDWYVWKETTKSGLVVPLGFRPIGWQEVEAEQEVYLAGNMHGHSHAYGPFWVVSPEDRKLRSSIKRFMHYAEDLLVKEEE
jgi:hypothetical protein